MEKTSSIYYISTINSPRQMSNRNAHTDIRTNRFTIRLTRITLSTSFQSRLDIDNIVLLEVIHFGIEHCFLGQIYFYGCYHSIFFSHHNHIVS